MGKRVFWIFISFIFVATSSTIAFVQSEKFAKIVKKKIHEHSTSLGVQIDFERLRIGVLPPSISLVKLNMKVLSKDNFLNINEDAEIQVGRLGISFRMIQAFSRGLNINKLFIEDAKLKFVVKQMDSSIKTGEKLSELVHRPLNFSIGNQFEVNCRQLELKKTKVDIAWQKEGGKERIEIENIDFLAITPEKNGTNILANLEKIEFDISDRRENLNALKLNADLQRSLLQIDTLDIERKSMVLHSSGKVVGSIDQIDHGKAELEVLIRGPINEVADYVPKLSSLRGELQADVKISGHLRDPTVSGKAKIKEFGFQMWNTKELDLSGSYSPQGITIDSFVASQDKGSLETKGKIEIPLPFMAEFLPLQFKLNKARFEDFSGDLKTDLNNLKFEITGDAQVRLEFKRQTGKSSQFQSLAVTPEATISELELNNQSYGKQKPYKKIFVLKPFQLDGQLLWSKGNLEFKNVNFKFPSGNFSAAGTIVKDEGFQITGRSEKIDMGAEMGSISGIPFVGSGALGLNVHGPAKEVMIDITMDQKEAKFLDFDLGSVSGTVSFDEHRDLVIVKDVQGKKNNSPYKVSGKVDVGTGDSIDLQASFQDSDPNDLFALFKKKIEKLTWIPYGMGGTVSGTAHVGGGYSKALESLDISADIMGSNLAYKGEIVQELRATAGVQKGVIFGKNIRGKKYTSAFRAQVEYFPNDELKYNFFADDAKLRSLDWVNSLSASIDGTLNVSSEGKGRWETLVSKTKVSVKNGFIRTRPLPNVDFSFDTNEQGNQINLALGKDVSFSSSLMVDPTKPSKADLRIQHSDFGYLFCLINKKACNNASVTFFLDGWTKLNWLGGAWRLSDGQGEIREIALGKDRWEIKNKAFSPVKISKGDVSAQEISLEGDGGKLGILLAGRVDGTKIDSKLNGSLSFRFIETLSSLIEEAKGKINLDVGLSGTIDDAKFFGAIKLDDNFLRLSGLDAPVETIQGKILLDGYTVTPTSVVAQVGGGAASLGGYLNLYLNRPPKFAIDLNLSNNRVKFFPVNYAEFSEAKLTFTGDAPPYLFAGNAVARKIVMRDNFDVAGKQKSLKNARYLPEKLSGAKSFYEIKIRAIADGNVEVQNDLLDAEFKGEVTLLNNFEFPQIMARGDLVKGRLLFRNASFLLDHAIIRTPNKEEFNPQFSIGGVADVDSYRINIFASGTVEKPKFSFSSYPSLAQEDIISLLAFGIKSSNEGTKIRQEDSSAITYSEMGSVLLDQLNLSKDLKSKGINVKVAPALIENEANIIRPKTVSSAAAPKVYLQTQVLKNLEATFGSTVGASQGQQMDASLEYRLGKKTSINAIYEQQGAGLDATDVKNSYGADLKFRWGFK